MPGIERTLRIGARLAVEVLPVQSAFTPSSARSFGCGDYAFAQDDIALPEKSRRKVCAGPVVRFVLVASTLLLLMAAPAVRACELCRESCIAPAKGKSTVVSQASAFNGSVLTMLAGTGLMAGLAGRAMVRAARGSGGEGSDESDAG